MKRNLILLIILLVSVPVVDAQIPCAVFNSNKGYVNLTELTGGLGLSITAAPYSKYLVGITTVNGYQVNRHIIIGGGTGALFYNEGLLVPLYVSGRFSTPSGHFRLWWYLNGDAGVLLNFKDFDYGTKFFLNPVAGVKYAITQTVALNLGAGFFSQVGPLSSRDSFINIKLGIIVIPER